MAVFVELDEDDASQPPDPRAVIKPVWTRHDEDDVDDRNGLAHKHNANKTKTVRDAPAMEDAPNRNSMTRAMGCYPIVTALASAIDLNTLDSLSKTCRRIRYGLLQYRGALLGSTLHCVNEDLPVDADDTLRYRARASNWFYMEEAGGRTSYNGKSGRCARDMVSGCRRCGTVVCRNCAIKPPAPIVLRDRHRRLCIGCCRAPLSLLVHPPLPRGTPIKSEDMQRAICSCQTDGVWLCQPCGRSIRGADYEYQAIWKWRNQYGEVLGGLGTGIGEGDRGVICGREMACSHAKDREQEIDCDAEDAREADGGSTPTTPGQGYGHGAVVQAHTPSIHIHHPPNAATLIINNNNHNNTGGSPSGSSSGFPWTSGANNHINDSTTSLGTHSIHHQQSGTASTARTPSPLLGPGYERHEIEGIGGVVKRKLVRMVRVGACVPEWQDEKARGEVLGREVSGKTRSWCGWCWRVIPGKKDYEGDGSCAGGNPACMCLW